MARRSYSDETKAAAMSALLEGQSVSKVAKEYEIPKGTVSNWKKAAKKQVEEEGVHGDRTQKKGESIGELLYSYLETNLRTLTEQSEAFADREWLKEQSASEAAVLHGVLTDKTVRLLEALGPDAPGPEDG